MSVPIALARICILSSAACWGQSAVWLPQGATTGNIYYNGGNVGIGTTSPGTPLQVEGLTTFHRDDWGNYTMILRGQKGGPPYNWGEYALMADYAGLSFMNTQTGNTLLLLGAGGGTSANILLAPSGGNVGIGTTNPSHLLHVAGTIGAEEVLVTSTGADYVFQPGYRLKPLSEVAQYIESNHHLPDIPSADEVKQKGMGVGEMEAKLLAKVEELTLHMIQQEKDNRELHQQNQKLQERITRLEAQTAR